MEGGSEIHESFWFLSVGSNFNFLLVYMKQNTSEGHVWATNLQADVGTWGWVTQWNRPQQRISPAAAWVPKALEIEFCRLDGTGAVRYSQRTEGSRAKRTWKPSLDTREPAVTFAEMDRNENNNQTGQKWDHPGVPRTGSLRTLIHHPLLGVLECPTRNTGKSLGNEVKTLRQQTH